MLTTEMFWRKNPEQLHVRLLHHLSLPLRCRVSMRVYTADDWQVIESVPSS